MTSNDRHASHDSPYRTSNHVPLSQNRHAPLTSVATSAFESHTDLNASYSNEVESGNGFVNSNGNGSMSPNRPYSPGARGQALQRQGSGFSLEGRMEGAGQAEIQMQSFDDGLPPAPPVQHSWKRIDRWLEDNYEELFENLGFPATINDVNELEHDLDCTLPQDVRESLQIHDGQERGGIPTGVIFGCMLLDCEEILQEWQNWRTVNEAYLNDTPSYEVPQAPIKAFAGSSTNVPIAQPTNPTNRVWKQDLLGKQDSQPTGAVQIAYAHPAWIPLARDWGGNNIAVDLAPGPKGRWGQIILMGRDYDCKYVVARSWSAFMATLADDMATDKWFIDEETKELKLREFKQPGVEPAYIDILRWRSDQKYGRKRQAKRPLRVNSNVSVGSSNGFSPYTSPISADDGRGRSPQRFLGSKGPSTSSPRGLVSSPLARVTEESSQPVKSDPETSEQNGDATSSKLVNVDTPTPSMDKVETLSSTPAPPTKADENSPRTISPQAGLDDGPPASQLNTTVPKLNGKVDEKVTIVDGEEMRNVEI